MTVTNGTSSSDHGYTSSFAKQFHAHKQQSNGGKDVEGLFPYPNPRVEGYHERIPLQPYPIGSVLPASKFPQNATPPKLFEALEIRGVKFDNRMWVAPMCQYSSDDGKATDHHFVHLGSMAMRGWGNIMIEATAVVPEGRITPEDSGIWSDEHIPGFKRIVDYVHGLQGKIGIQLAHAGRKASTPAPWIRGLAGDEGWKGGDIVPEQNGGWPTTTVGPSPISFNPGKYPMPVEASLEYIENLKKAYVDAVERCKTIGFDYIEIHGAHGYLIHEFLSPLSNQRKDQYGGSLENRLRLSLEIAQLIRSKWDKPLFYRTSASDWLENVEGPEKKSSASGKEEYGWWGIEQTTILAERLRDIGVDLFHVSSGGNDTRQQIKVGPKYQLPFAAHVKKNVPGILVGAVGIITKPHEAEEILENEEADVVFFARQILRDIDFPLQAAEELGVAAAPAQQYERAWTRMVVKREADYVVKHRNAEVEGEEGRSKDHKGENIHQSIP